MHRSAFDCHVVTRKAGTAMTVLPILPTGARLRFSLSPNFFVKEDLLSSQSEPISMQRNMEISEPLLVAASSHNTNASWGPINKRPFHQRCRRPGDELARLITTVPRSVRQINGAKVLGEGAKEMPKVLQLRGKNDANEE